ncbi:MAG: hypothetical protein ABSA39_16905 [Edaphobacter sp.]
MSAIDDTRKLLQDFLAPELRAITVRLDTLEKRIDGIDRKIDGNQSEIMAALRQVTDYAAVLSRLSKLEARLPEHAQ